jgi:hypothetical protein
MTNTGNPEARQPAKSRLPARTIVLIAVLVIGVAAVIVVGRSAFGVLYGLLTPPTVPIPEGLEQIQHTTPAFGTDDWLYASSQDACQITRYYLSQGASCRIAPEVCDTGTALTLRAQPGESVSRCTAEIVSGEASLRYEVVIATGYGETLPTRLRVISTLYYLASQADATP